MKKLNKPVLVHFRTTIYEEEALKRLAHSEFKGVSEYLRKLIRIHAKNSGIWDAVLFDMGYNENQVFK